MQKPSDQRSSRQLSASATFDMTSTRSMRRRAAPFGLSSATFVRSAVSRIHRSFLLCAFLTATSAFAADITTRDGTTYRKAEVVGVDRDGIRVMHASGVAKLRFEELPEPLQRQYHYDSAKVAAYRKQGEAARKSVAAQAAAIEHERQRQVTATQEAARRHAEEARRREQERITAEQREKQLEHFGRLIGMIVAAGFGLVLYFSPTIIGRRKTNVVAIFVFNLFLGWTVLGWILALVWAATKDLAMDDLARERLTAKEGRRYLD